MDQFWQNKWNDSAPRRLVALSVFHILVNMSNSSRLVIYLIQKHREGTQLLRLLELLIYHPAPAKSWLERHHLLLSDNQLWYHSSLKGYQRHHYFPQHNSVLLHLVHLLHDLYFIVYSQL